jgi:hypothetical protein
MSARLDKVQFGKIMGELIRESLLFVGLSLGARCAQRIREFRSLRRASCFSGRQDDLSRFRAGGQPQGLAPNTASVGGHQIAAGGNTLGRSRGAPNNQEK